jgi:hypothetical protein
MAIDELHAPWIEDWLSSRRFGSYLAAANGSRALALEIYEWNAKLGSAFLHDLGHLEVGIRNAYDTALSASVINGESHWTDQTTISKLFPDKDTNKIPREIILKARREASKNGSTTPLPGKIIAEITFGFWSHLTSSGNEKTIWVPYLHSKFPLGTDREKIHKPMRLINEFRNRVAHYEPIMQNANSIHRQIVFIASQVLPTEVGNHLKANSAVPDLLEHKPFRK